MATPGLATTSGINFTVGVAPTLSTLSQTSANSTDPQFTLTLTGSNFVSGAVVNWGSTPLATSYGRLPA